MSKTPTHAAAAPTDAATDPLLTALLNFEPVPRLNKRKDGWTERCSGNSSPCSQAPEAVGDRRRATHRRHRAAPAADDRPPAARPLRRANRAGRGERAGRADARRV
ncbi:MAG: hypothetical protein WKF52_06775 [Sphingomicrobium sp.]